MKKINKLKILIVGLTSVLQFINFTENITDKNSVSNNVLMLQDCK